MAMGMKDKGNHFFPAFFLVQCFTIGTVGTYTYYNYVQVDTIFEQNFFVGCKNF